MIFQNIMYLHITCPINILKKSFNIIISYRIDDQID